MRDANLNIVFAERPAVVAGHAFTTGWIPQTTFEKPLNPSIMTVGVRSGMGCDADKLPLDKQSATSIPDDFQHEQGTVNMLKEINPDYVIPMHCSGEAFYAMVTQAMPGKVL